MAILALIALAALALLPPGGLTICFGHDGHLALSMEPSHEPAPPADQRHCPCDPAPDAAEEVVPAHAPCDDLPLPGTTATALPRSGDGADHSDAFPHGEVTMIAPAIEVCAEEPLARASLAATAQHEIAITPALSPRRLV